MTPERIREKCDAFYQAWRGRFSYEPARHTITMCMCVALAETSAGDAWPASHNWGAVTLRPLNPAERQAVAAAGLVATVGAMHEEIARLAQQAIVNAGLPLPAGEIHCDSSKATGPYFVWFAAFPDDVAGADYFIRALCVQRITCRVIVERPDSTLSQLAGAMRASKYYTGIHDNTTSKGTAENIADYTRFISGWRPQLEAALDDWTAPVGDPTAPPLEGEEQHYRDPSWAGDVHVLGVQQVLNRLHVPDDQGDALDEDGLLGPLTRQAVSRYQLQHEPPLDPTGEVLVGGATEQALQESLKQAYPGEWW